MRENTMTFRTITTSFVFAALAAQALACPFCKAQQSGLFIGETRILGNDTVFTWIDVAKDGKLTALGITFNELALEGLPQDLAAHAMDAEVWAALPKKAKELTAFDHVGINWNPKGHQPLEIYGAPHFDFHFYTIPTSERSQIKLEGDDLKVCQQKPPAGYMPDGYMYAPQSEEKYMGAHWVALNSPELNGKPFTSTFIYGSYGGRMIFAEPMITKAFLEQKPNQVFAIPAPKKVERSGWYPTAYGVRFDAVRREYTISLEGLVYLSK